MLIFDEVDAGIGGVTADVVATKMREISTSRQVFLITHRAQIAAAGEGHYRVMKDTSTGRTEVRVERLEGEERVREIARLLSGEVTPLSIEHAREILGIKGTGTETSARR